MKGIPLNHYDEEEMALRQRLGEFGPKLERRNQLQTEMDTARVAFETWFEETYRSNIDEVAAIDAETEQLREWFNGETARLYFEGRSSLFDKSVQPRPVIRAVYTDEDALRDWASQFDEVYAIDKKADPLRKAARALVMLDRKDLLQVDVGLAAKIAASTYEDGTPVYEGPFTVEQTVTQTSLEKLTKLITTFHIELEFDKRQQMADQLIESIETKHDDPS